MTRLTFLVLCALVPVGSTPAHLNAQIAGSASGVADSPHALAEAFLGVVSTGELSGPRWELLPTEARDWLEDASGVEDGRLVPGFARVVHRTEDRALLALAVHVEYGGGTGSQTLATRGISGFYEAMRTAEGWRFGGLRSLGSQASILAQELDVRIRPAQGLDVADTLTVHVRGPGGFAVRLNHAVELAEVRVQGEVADHAFGGGLLWIDVPQGEHRISVEYAVDVARDSTAHPNSGHFAADYGHVRHQYLWHPFYDFQSQAQNARFSIRVEAPAEVHVATDMPQTETVTSETRIVRARSREPTYALSLFYDRDWEPTTREVQGFVLARFATPGTPPSPDSLAAVFRRSYEVIAERFGPPTGGYLAAVQGRAREGSGWLYRSNDAMAMAAEGGANMWREGALPRATFGHEVAHGWTRPTGPAANFLREGWATYVEALLLDGEYGPGAVERFWENQRMLYFARVDGGASILDDPNNQGIAYYKGAWILRMLRDYVGLDAFAEGFRRYMAIPVGEPAGHEEFARAMSEASGTDVAAFLRPWLHETVAPAVVATLEDEHVVLRQVGPPHILAVELDLHRPGGPQRRTVLLDEPEARVMVGSGVTRVDVDPDHRLLIRRTRGDTARFVFDPPEGEEPESVRLEGPFLDEPLEAVRAADGRWSVRLELTEGAYLHWWRVDGEQGDLRSLEVEPRMVVSDEAFGAGVPPEG